MIKWKVRCFYENAEYTGGATKMRNYVLKKKK